jgi:hypothetical protein
MHRHFDLRRGYVPERQAHVEFCASRKWQYIWSTTVYVCVYIYIYIYIHTHTHTRQSGWNPNSNTLEPDWPQHHRPVVCVIAQQYSSATFFSLRFTSRKKICGASFKNIISRFYVFKKLGVKLRNLKFRNSGVSVTGTGVFLPLRGRGRPVYDSDLLHQ